MPTMMKLLEFKEVFLSVACVKLGFDRSNAIINRHYNLIKEYTIEELKSVIINYTFNEERGSDFPVLAWWIDKLKAQRYNNSIQKSDDYYHSRKYIEKCNSEKSKAARRQFLEDINAIALAAKIGTEVEIQGKTFKPLRLEIKTDHFDYPISGLHEILLNIPLKNARQLEAQDADQG